MTDLPPPVPEPPPMGDEADRVWLAYDRLMRRCLELEEISDRLAATAADPLAVDDYMRWKAAGWVAGPGDQG